MNYLLGKKQIRKSETSGFQINTGDPQPSYSLFPDLSSSPVRYSLAFLLLFSN